MLRVVPGIRAKKVSTEVQTRVATAKDAAEAGASYIVVGRPILEAADPIAAAKDIL
ncbi:orotidine 5'-phosphate decarboxylase / HUMPS family protein, partial [Cloacibacillus evryensis]|uniref:orotidine 5'-phosphate decarboxylase / HUMPS family protein n=1 Tax=Cloacibacillus evryensis TaxID=508460 RepID=UPI002108D149